jgi:uncharacterized membrane protein YdjX (TVP38/TMEM64 family)
MLKTNAMLTGKTGKIVRIAWVCFLLVCIILYVRFAPYLTGENMAAFLSQYQGQLLVLYFILCILRGFTLIPSTPFLFAGIILFPARPFLLLGVFMLSLAVVAALLYYISGYADLGHYFRKAYPGKIQKIRQKLDGKHGFWFILLWSFAPFTPTDLVCYVAGSLKMRFIRFMLPLVCGEAIISSIYIFNGTALIQNII